MRVISPGTVWLTEAASAHSFFNQLGIGRQIEEMHIDDVFLGRAASRDVRAIFIETVTDEALLSLDKKWAAGTV